jgi:hypothetical protein
MGNRQTSLTLRKSDAIPPLASERLRDGRTRLQNFIEYLPEPKA